MGLALNERGEAAGSSSVASGATHAALWRTGGRPIDLGTLGGGRSSAGDLNNRDTVTGTAQIQTGQNRAFIWSAGKMAAIGVLGSSTSSSSGYGINDAGAIVGFASLQDGGHGFVWTRRGGIKDLGTLGGRLSFALAINSFGAVAGASDLPDSASSTPVIWRGAKPSPFGLPTGFDFGFAYGISFTGQVAGYFEKTGGAGSDVFISDKGQLRDIGRLADYQFSRGLAINSAGQVVGPAFRSLGARTHPFLSRAGVIVDLNTLLPAGSPWDLRNAYDVNDVGQIVGDGILNGETRGFVLTPPRAEQVANIRAFVSALQPGTTSLEREAASLLGAGCKGIRALASLAPKQRKLGAVRRDALVVRVGALHRSLRC